MSDQIELKTETDATGERGERAGSMFGISSGRR